MRIHESNVCCLSSNYDQCANQSTIAGLRRPDSMVKHTIHKSANNVNPMYVLRGTCDGCIEILLHRESDTRHTNTQIRFQMREHYRNWIQAAALLGQPWYDQFAYVWSDDWLSVNERVNEWRVDNAHTRTPARTTRTKHTQFELKSSSTLRSASLS